MVVTISDRSPLNFGHQQTRKRFLSTVLTSRETSVNNRKKFMLLPVLEAVRVISESLKLTAFRPQVKST